MSKPWERDWGGSKAKPWERDWTAQEPAAEQSFPESGVSTFGNLSGKGVANNILALPGAAGDQIGNLLALGGAGVSSLANVAQGNPADFMSNYRAQQQIGPARMFRDIPQPTANDVGALVQSIPSLMPGGQSPQEAFGQNLAQLEFEDARAREQNPWTSMAANVVADVSSILMLRRPMVGPLGEVDAALSKSINVSKDLPPLQYVLNNIASKLGVKTMGRAAFRAGETGFEAMMLDMMHRDDPMETAPFAAAAQVAGSAGVSLAKDVMHMNLTGAGLKIAAYAFAGASMMQVLETATPGFQQRFIDSFETSYDKITAFLAMGAVSGLAGYGRLRGTELEKVLPNLADAITAIPRNTMNHMIENVVDSGDSPSRTKIGLVVNQLVKDPEFFGKDTGALLKGFETGNIVGAIDDLWANSRDFQNKIFSIAPPDLQAQGPSRGVIQRVQK